MTFLTDRRDAIMKQIIAYEDAMFQLANNNIQSYQLDTGQTVEKVTKLDIEFMKGIIDGLYNQYTVLDNRIKGRGSVVGQPGW